MLKRPAIARSLALAFCLTTSTAGAQAVLGPGDDALVLPRGVMRLRVLQQWTSFNERYGLDTPNRPAGALEPLAIDFNLDTVGTREFPSLGAVQAGLQSLTGNPDFVLSLGRTVVNADVSVSATPIVLEMGVTSRLSMGLVVPYVKTRTSIFFNVNPNGTEGNLGFNPFINANTTAIGQNTILRNEFNASIAAVQGQIAACTANPGASPACPAVLANGPTLVANAIAFRDGLVQLYGVDTSTRVSPFIPINGTDAQLQLDARIAGLSSLFQSFGAPAINTRPFHSTARLGVADAQRVLTDPLFGVVADPLETVERSHLGDIELGAKYLLWDTFNRRKTDRMTPSGINYRLAAGALFRFGTGQSDLPQNFVDVGTGNEGQNDFELRGYGDILIGRHFWTSFVARYNWQLSDDEDVRISDLPNQRLTAAFRQQNVERNLGDISEIEVNPRWVVNDYFGLMAHYYYRFKRQDEYEDRAINVPAAVTGYSDVTINPRTLNAETQIEEWRLGWGFSFSTIGAFGRGKAKLPLEVTYLHWQTTRGAGGNAPKLFSDQIQVRLYARIFGG